MRLGIESRGIVGKVEVYSQPTYFPDWSGLRVPREYLLELGAAIKQRVGGWTSGGEDPVIPLEMRIGKGVPLQSWGELGDLI